MALSSCLAPVLIGDSSLQNWDVIGSGGFGQIYKARHIQWGWDVAIKLLHYDDGSSSSLLREADLMLQGGSPYVLRVLGVFHGRLPFSGPSIHRGIVMEFMERGSLASLQDAVPTPWPLSFRLAHQVALGMNFLHSLSPPLLHLDLKPNNVLLDSSLSVKLTDFGLARYYHTVTRSSKKNSGDEAGTISYMPPEAFTVSYKPTKASDIYSYGILLWSIVTGEKPYANAISSLVRFRIPEGDRPSLAGIDLEQAEGLKDLVELMKNCWVNTPNDRPPFLQCTAVTEKLYEIHKCMVNDAVHQVLAKLDQREEERRITEGCTKIHVTQPLAIPNVQPTKAPNKDLTRPPPTQESAVGSTTNQRQKQSVKDHTSPDTSANQKKKGSSISSNQTRGLPPSHLPSKTTGDRTATPSSLPFRQNLFGQYQRQYSSPEAFPHRSGGMSIHLSNVNGMQVGDNNHMYVNTTEVSERRRHPTAPNSGSHMDRTGNVG